MTKEEKSDYLDKWGMGCFICGTETERKDMTLFQSIIPLEKYPDHAEPEYIIYYMACPKCKHNGELV